MEKTCLDCSAYLPASAEGPTEFGICLNDEAFEPFVEELLEGTVSASCQALMERNKFVGDRTACPDFQESEVIEIDDNSPLGQRVRSLAERGELTPEALEEALLEEQLRNINWETVPVDDYARRLESTQPEERAAAIESLGGLVSLGNRAAFRMLLEYLAALPLPVTIHEVHVKREILRRLSCGPDKTAVVPYLIGELQAIPSNNTTRQWISDIFQFLERCPWSVIREPLDRMLDDKRFSPRFKRKVEEALFRSRSRSEG